MTIAESDQILSRPALLKDRMRVYFTKKEDKNMRFNNHDAESPVTRYDDGTPKTDAIGSSSNGLDKIRQLISFYQQKGFDARLVGSLGKKAALGEDDSALDNIDKNDIDILLVNPQGDLRRTIKDAQAIAGHDIIDKSIFTKEEKPYISYRNLQIEVNPKVLEMRKGHLGDISVPTFDLNTLLHLSALYIPVFRPKDIKSARKFIRQIRDRNDKLPEELFKPFHDLMKLKIKSYPLDVIFGKVYFHLLKHCTDSTYHFFRPILKKLIYFRLVKIYYEMFDSGKKETYTFTNPNEELTHKDRIKIAPHRIHIIGGPGSGKTTLSHEISNKLGYPSIDLDELRRGEQQEKLDFTTRKERASIYSNQDRWISEGIYTSWVDEFLEKADSIVFIDSPFFERMRNVLGRATKRWNSTGLDKELAILGFALCYMLPFENNTRARKNEKDGLVTRKKILNLLENYKNKVTVLKNKEDIKEYLSSLDST